jgi:hypothetical protein
MGLAPGDAIIPVVWRIVLVAVVLLVVLLGVTLM